MARSARSGGADDKPEGVAADEPLAEWERDLLPDRRGLGRREPHRRGHRSTRRGAATSSAPVSTSNGASAELTRKERRG